MERAKIHSRRSARGMPELEAPGAVQTDEVPLRQSLAKLFELVSKLGRGCRVRGFGLEVSSEAARAGAQFAIHIANQTMPQRKPQQPAEQSQRRRQNRGVPRGQAETNRSSIQHYGSRKI